LNISATGFTVNTYNTATTPTLTTYTFNWQAVL
jgi:hypothetical protein